MMTPEDSSALSLSQHLNRNIAQIFDVNFFISIILLQFAFILGITLIYKADSRYNNITFNRVVVQRPPPWLQSK